VGDATADERVARSILRWLRSCRSTRQRPAGTAHQRWLPCIRRSSGLLAAVQPGHQPSRQFPCMPARDAGPAQKFWNTVMILQQLLPVTLRSTPGPANGSTKSRVSHRDDVRLHGADAGEFWRWHSGAPRGRSPQPSGRCASPAIIRSSDRLTSRSSCGLQDSLDIDPGQAPGGIRRTVLQHGTCFGVPLEGRAELRAPLAAGMQ
jgi:hypothetical protein